jgi:hypothetical protein
MSDSNHEIVTVLQEIRDTQREQTRLLSRLCLILGIAVAILALTFVLTIG